MEIIELIKYPATYFIMTGLSVSILYFLSRSTFRKWKKQVLIIAIVLMIAGIGILALGESLSKLAPFLFIPLYSTVVATWIEKQYSQKYKMELPDTSFWYLTGEQKSNRNNKWNTILLLSIIVVPINTCVFLIIFIK